MDHELDPQAQVHPEIGDPAILVFSQASADAPHDAYRQLRDGCPVARSDFAGTPAVYLSRYDDVLWALRNPEIFSSAAERVRSAASKALHHYFERSVEARRRTPDDGLLRRLVQSEIDGEHLTQAELLGISHLMLLGGLDTVTATLDCIVAYLANHPDQ